MNTERLTIKNLEIKALSKGQFEGYGSVFGNLDRGHDVVMPGAFKQTLAQHKADGTLPVMFWMHKPDQIPGKWLAMSEDSNGLYVKGELADTQLGRDVHTLLEMKAVRGLSIGYVPQDSEFTDGGVRLLKQVDLLETSIVSIAMNPLAEITNAKSRLSANGEYVPELAEFKRKCEEFFRGEGISRKNAEMFVANMFKAYAGVIPGEPGESPSKHESTDKKDGDGASPAAIKELELSDFQAQTLAYELGRLKNRFF